MTSPESSDFFEAMYAGADGDDSGIPWQAAMSRRLIGDWLTTFDAAGHDRALVVAAGLGDDAAALAGRGLDVVAFDYASTAVDWARSRHPDAAVDWQVADLFASPEEWLGAFDLVVEVFTVQSIEPGRQALAAETVRSFVGPGGKLVAVALVRHGDDAPQGPPWPLHGSTLEALGQGLVERHRHTEDLDAGVSCILTELDRPGDRPRRR